MSFPGALVLRGAGAVSTVRAVAGPLSAPGAKATLALSMALSVLGFGGLIWSWNFLGHTPGTALPEQDGLLPSADPEASAALLELWVRSPLQRGLKVANLLVSGLLVVASYVLMLRRPSARWWVTQALGGKILHTLASMVTSLWFYARHEAAVNEIFAEQVAAADAAGGGSLAMGIAAGEFCFGFAMLGVYVLLLWVSRRDDVRAFVGATAEGPPGAGRGRK